MYTKKSLYFVSFSILLISLITSCANFMKGENLKKEIEEKIEHENAAYCKVRISPSKNASENTGMTIPSANVYANVYKPQDNIDLSFEPSASWKFHYWTAEPEGSVEFTGGIKSISTTAHLLNDNDGDEILIMPHCEPRLEPQLSKPNDPVNPKNSSITLRFEYELSNSEDDLNDISVEIAGENIKEYFEDPVYESNKHEIKFEAKSDKILDFTSGTKIVKITIPSKFYYTVNGLNVEMADDKILEYKINEETIDKLKFEWQKGRHGDFESLYDSEKNILESQIVNFIMDQNCYFSGWEITTAKINSGEVDEFNIVTDSDYKGTGVAKLVKDASGKTILRMIEPSEVDAKTLAINDVYRVTLEVLSAYDEKIIVKPVVFERPTVTFSLPSLQAQPKNTPISIHFSKPIANLIELENEIKIEIDGSSVKGNFIAPKYSEDLKSITYEANTNNFIDTQNTTKTVTVTIPKDFYYEDGAEQIDLGKESVFTYKVTSETSIKGDFNFSNGDAGKTKINWSTGSKSFNIGDEFTVRVTSEDSNYEFGGWYIATASGILPEGCLKIVEDLLNKEVTITVLKQITGVDVYPIYYKKPMIEAFLPSTTGLNTVAKDSPIIIKFASKFDKPYLEQIKITKNGEDVSACFLTPEVSSDGTTVTYNVNYDNLLTVNGSNESIVVTIPEDISYTTEDGTLVSAGVTQTRSYRVKPQTDKTLLVSFRNTSSGGVMNFSGTRNLSMGESLEVIYSTQPGYNFAGWTITGTPSEIMYNEEDLSKDTIIITAKNEGAVSITGSAVFYPEISDYEPKYNINGVECDTPVTVNFNTLMDHSTINKDTIQITNKHTGADYSKYFTISCRDVSGMTVADFKVDESITELFGTNILSTFDIRLKFDQSSIRSAGASGGANLTGLKYDWYYRINSGTEKVLPHITEMHLYKTKNADGTYADELTNKDFAEWEAEDFHQNHVRKVYMKILGYDDDSGLSHINYSEKLFRTSIGTKSSLAAEVSTLGNKDSFTIVETLPSGSVVYKYENEIDFSTTFPDGVVKFDFELEDRAGNKAEKSTYYVVKDSGVSGNSVKDTGMLDEPRFAENGIDTVHFRFNQYNLSDTFYKVDDKTSYSDTLTVKKVEWGYSILPEHMQEIVPMVATSAINTTSGKTINSGETYYMLQRDENRETYLRVTVADSVGNTYFKTVAIPEKAIYVGTDGYSELYKAFNQDCPLEYSYARISHYTYDAESNSYSGGVASGYDIRPNCHTYNGVYYISTSTSTYATHCNQYEFNGWKIRGTYAQIYDPAAVAYEFTADDMDEELELEIGEVTAEQNSGYVDIKITYPDSFEKNPDLTYLVAVRRDGYTGHTYTEGSNLHLLYGEKYWISPAVVNNKHEFKYGKEVSYVVNDDTVPPDMSPIGVNNGTHSYYQTSPNFVKVTVPTDATGLKTEADGLVHLEYWVIANESVKSGFKERPEDDIISYPSKFITYDPNNPPANLRIPLDDAPENSYTVYVKLVDSSINQNYKFISIYAYNVLREHDASFKYVTDYNMATSSYNIGYYDTFRYSEEFDLKWWQDTGYIKYWTNATPDFSDDEDWVGIDPTLDYEDKYAIVKYKEGVREANIINQYCADHFEYDKDGKKAFIYTLDDTHLGLVTVEAFVNGNWDTQLAAVQPASHCLNIAFTEDDRVQYLEKNGQNWCYNDDDFVRTCDLYHSSSGKFIRILAMDVDGGGIISNYWKTIYVYPDYYKDKESFVCNNKNIMELANGLQVFTDQPVLVHTYSCSSNLGDDPDLWLNHGFETGMVEKNTTFTYDKSYLKDVENGMYYTTIVHFVDGTTLMTTPKKK